MFHQFVSAILLRHSSTGQGANRNINKSMKTIFNRKYLEKPFNTTPTKLNSLLRERLQFTLFVYLLNYICKNKFVFEYNKWIIVRALLLFLNITEQYIRLVWSIRVLYIIKNLVLYFQSFILHFYLLYVVWLKLIIDVIFYLIIIQNLNKLPHSVGTSYKKFCSSMFVILFYNLIREWESLT